ncbi:MAG: cytochrome c maturation protein CcmE [Limnohabitans sp.]|jgi:cytochrome c-type biogenesis protein CcmE|uniref:cytochrome c maturation protein CcmE n=1 Tax=Limnohabitans sp. TaxID=1907725 RepID=UPI0025DC348C|nr:cytochrome c maturation protein CcmE [Limnohabitans sp.]MCO4089131.1 cytochrome c maturation protein CcmE [Limnohabitans sp.]
MKNRHQRLLGIGLGLLLLCGALFFVLNAFQSNLVFFFTPTQVAAGEAPKEGNFRVGGLVKAGSIQRDGMAVVFVVTDTLREVPVRYVGLLPDLFKEGKGVVAQGRLDGGQMFVASEVLAKHDENYMPPEAQHALDEAAKARAGAALVR